LRRGFDDTTPDFVGVWFLKRFPIENWQGQRHSLAQQPQAIEDHQERGAHVGGDRAPD
jgi:hypothetical protein